MKDSTQVENPRLKELAKALFSAGIMNQRLREAVEKGRGHLKEHDAGCVLDGQGTVCICGRRDIDLEMYEALAFSQTQAEKQTEAALKIFRAADRIWIKAGELQGIDYTQIAPIWSPRFQDLIRALADGKEAGLE